MSLPTDRQERKNLPLARAVLDYFPDALAGVAQCSLAGNIQHNNGDDIYWARGKSNDHADCILRHMVDRDEVDTDGIPHVFKVAWRALAMAQEYAEAHGARPSKASRFEEAPVPTSWAQAWTDDSALYEGVKEEEKSAAENIWEPAVGDRVKIGVPGHPHLAPHTGLTGMITKITPHRALQYTVNFDNSTQYEVYGRNELVKLG